MRIMLARNTDSPCETQTIMVEDATDSQTRLRNPMCVNSLRGVCLDATQSFDIKRAQPCEVWALTIVICNLSLVYLCWNCTLYKTLVKCRLLLYLLMLLERCDLFPGCQWIHTSHTSQLRLSIPVSVQLKASSFSFYGATLSTIN